MSKIIKVNLAENIDYRQVPPFNFVNAHNDIRCQYSKIKQNVSIWSKL